MVPIRGLRRPDAAAFFGVSASKFDQMVADGRAPRPGRIDKCIIWDLRKLEEAFDLLFNPDDSGGGEEWKPET